MGKIKEYFIKRRQMRIAYSEMKDAEERITCYPEAYYLDTKVDDGFDACKAVFQKVYASHRSQNPIDDSGCTSFCHLFNSDVCENRKCPMYARNIDYFVCKEKYEAARMAYTNLVKEIMFWRKK